MWHIWIMPNDKFDCTSWQYVSGQYFNYKNGDCIHMVNGWNHTCCPFTLSMWNVLTSWWVVSHLWLNAGCDSIYTNNELLVECVLIKPYL
jgi:hypothetical protein